MIFFYVSAKAVRDLTSQEFPDLAKEKVEMARVMSLGPGEGDR